MFRYHIHFNFKLDKNCEMCSHLFALEIIYTEKNKFKDNLFIYKKQYAAIYSDFEHFKNRQFKERKKFLISANKEIISNLLNVFDNLDNALAPIDKICYKTLNNAPNNLLASVQSGLILILKNFTKILRKYGLFIINSLGTKFNPVYHEAIRNLYQSKVNHEIIIEEYQKGYTLNNQLLRASKVAVNFKPL